MFLEKTAALAFADIHMRRHIVKADVLAVIILDKGDDVAEPLQMLLGVLLLLGKVGKIVVKHAEDLQEKDVDLQLVIRRLFQGQAVDVLDPAKDFLMPRHMLFKLQ